MARYTTIDISLAFLPVDLRRHLIPGPLRGWIVDHELDFTGLDGRYRSIATTPTARPPTRMRCCSVAQACPVCL